MKHADMSPPFAEFGLQIRNQLGERFLCETFERMFFVSLLYYLPEPLGRSLNREESVQRDLVILAQFLRQSSFDLEILRCFSRALTDNFELLGFFTEILPRTVHITANSR